MIAMMIMILPIVVVLEAKVMTQGVVVHKPAQPVPSLLVHVTYRASCSNVDDDNESNNNNNNNNNDNNDDDVYRLTTLQY